MNLAIYHVTLPIIITGLTFLLVQKAPSVTVIIHCLMACGVVGSKMVCIISNPDLQFDCSEGSKQLNITGCHMTMPIKLTGLAI